MKTHLSTCAMPVSGQSALLTSDGRSVRALSLVSNSMHSSTAPREYVSVCMCVCVGGGGRGKIET